MGQLCPLPGLHRFCLQVLCPPWCSLLLYSVSFPSRRKHPSAIMARATLGIFLGVTSEQDNSCSSGCLTEAARAPGRTRLLLPMLSAAFPRPAEDADTCTALGHGAPGAQELHESGAHLGSAGLQPGASRAGCGARQQQGPGALGCPGHGWGSSPASQTGLSLEHKAGGSMGALG